MEALTSLSLGRCAWGKTLTVGQVRSTHRLFINSLVWSDTTTQTRTCRSLSIANAITWRTSRREMTGATPGTPTDGRHKTERPSVNSTTRFFTDDIFYREILHTSWWLAPTQLETQTVFSETRNDTTRTTSTWSWNEKYIHYQTMKLLMWQRLTHTRYPSRAEKYLAHLVKKFSSCGCDRYDHWPKWYAKKYNPATAHLWQTQWQWRPSWKLSTVNSGCETYLFINFHRLLSDKREKAQHVRFRQPVRTAI